MGFLFPAGKGPVIPVWFFPRPWGLGSWAPNKSFLARKFPRKLGKGFQFKAPNWGPWNFGPGELGETTGPKARKLGLSGPGGKVFQGSGFHWAQGFGKPPVGPKGFLWKGGSIPRGPARPGFPRGPFLWVEGAFLLVPGQPRQELGRKPWAGLGKRSLTRAGPNLGRISGKGPKGGVFGPRVLDCRKLGYVGGFGGKLVPAGARGFPHESGWVAQPGCF